MTENQENNTIRNLLWGGIITLIINLLVSYCQDQKKVEMEKIQFESTLIINAIDKNNIELSKKNIKFLIASGLISNKNQKILTLLTDSTFSIKLPDKDTIFIEPQNPSEIGSSFLKSLYSAQILDENDKPLEGVEVTIKTYTRDNKTVKGSYYAKTISDKNGLFKIPIPEGGIYSLSIQKVGYIGINTRNDNNKRIHSKEIKLYKKQGFFKDLFH